MYKAQYKSRSPFESWTTHGVYKSEAAAVSAALSRKNKGALLVRVIDKKQSVIYSA